tara:strand:+ start:466 stop:1008 length:543 start_codon:yes stop_codon:yes gene_type:complete
MKPRFEEMSYETTILLEKANQLNSRLDLLEKASMAEKDKYCMKNFGKKYSECSEKQKAQCDKVHGKADKDNKMKGEDKDCPSCGSKMSKGGCMKMGCGGKMAKAQPGYQPEKITDVNPHFVAESGGQTKSGYFTTNGKTIETEDAKPKRKKADSKVNMEKLSSRQNPHSDTGVVREEQFD